MRPDTKQRFLKSAGRLRELSHLAGRVNLPAAALGFLMGRAVILGNLSPFGLSYFAAVACLIPSSTIVTGIAVLLGGATASGSGGIPTGTMSIVLLHLMMRAVKSQPGAARLSRAAGAALVARITVKGVLLALGEFNPYTALVIVFEGLSCAALTVIFALGLRALQSGTPFDRPYSAEETTCAATLFACAVTGIGGLRAGPLLVKNVVGSALAATVGYVGGSTAGAAAGVAAGLIASLSGTAQPSFAGVQALSGLMAGMFRDLGRLGSFSGFLLGSVAMSLYASSPGVLVQSMTEALAGAAIILVIPGGVARSLRRLLNPPEAKGAAPAPAVEAPVAKLRGYSLALREISRAFDQAYTLPKEEPDRMPRLFGAIASRVCERCRDYRRCWEAEFRATYRGMFDLIRRAEEEGSLPVDGVESAGTLRCRYPDRVALCINHLAETENMVRRWQRRVMEGRDILGAQMRMASRLMDEVASEFVNGAQPARAAEPRKLAYTAGVAQANKNGFEISGDSVLLKELRESRLLAALSDGMGAGASAAEESKAAVHLVETLMDAGFDRDSAVGTVNSVLVARATGEAFATLDMMHVDLTTCDAEFVKIGACPSFIKRGNEVAIIRAQSLPAGILSEIPVETVPHKLLPDDTVVMVTDGVLGARKDPSRKEPWVASFLARSRWMPAQELCDRILERACSGVRSAAEEIKDDMTVVVVQFPGA